jgi:HlyD family secretion protein
MSATVELDALQDVVLPAVIENIALSGQPVNGIVNYDVSFTIDVDDPRVRVGMTAEANIVIERRDNVLTLPNVYIRRDGTRAFVNVLKPDNSVEEIEIALGLQGRDTSEVLTGLRAGDTAVINFADDRFSIFGG